MKHTTLITILALCFFTSSISAFTLESALRAEGGGLQLLLPDSGADFDTSVKNSLKANPSFEQFVELMKEVKDKTKEAPVKSIKKILQALELEVVQDQLSHDNLALEIKKNCTDELTYRDEQIAEATVLLSKAEESKSSCEASLTRNQANLGVNLQVQKDKSDEITALQSIRTQQHRAYGDAIRDYQEAIRIIEGAIPLVEQLVSPVYLQIKSPESIAEAVDHFKKNTFAMIVSSFRFHKSAALSQVIANLAQITKDVNIRPSDVARMIELLGQLKVKLTEELNKIDEQEQNQLEAHNQQIDALEALLDVVRNQEHSISGLIVELKACISDEEAILLAAGIKKRRNTNIKTKLQNFCNSFAEEATLAKAIREESKKLYNQLGKWLTSYAKSQKGKKGNDKKPAAGGDGKKDGAAAGGKTPPTSAPPPSSAPPASSSTAAGGAPAAQDTKKLFMVEVSSDAVEDALNDVWLNDA